MGEESNILSAIVKFVLLKLQSYRFSHFSLSLRAGSVIRLAGGWLYIFRNFLNESSFEELLERDNTKTIHTKNLQKLMIEVYKSLNHLNPEYMWEFFVKKDVQYNLRTKELCKLPSVSSQRYGLNSLSFRGSLLWNTIDDEIKLSPSLEVFKKKVRSWNGISCTCFICT